MAAAISADEVCMQGERIYECELREQFSAADEGKYVVIGVESGDYELDANRTFALDRANAKHPDALLYIKRIGYAAAVKLGGRFQVSRP